MANNSPTQKQMIAAHLRNYGSIEPLTALREYGCYRLGAVIFELKKDGMNIVTHKQSDRSRITGRPVQFARYELCKDEAVKEATL
jgi:hypothetical protein